MAKTKATGKGAVTSSKTPKSLQITKIVVNLSHLKLSAYAGTVLAYEFHCVVGRPGHVTEPGRFHIFKKEEMHLHRAYGNTPMPYSMFFSSDGKAIHGTPAATVRSFAGYLGLGNLIPAVGSHGCVGLSEEDARLSMRKHPRRPSWKSSRETDAGSSEGGKFDVHACDRAYPLRSALDLLIGRSKRKQSAIMSSLNPRRPGTAHEDIPNGLRVLISSVYRAGAPQFPTCDMGKWRGSSHRGSDT